MEIGAAYPQIELGGDPTALDRFGRSVEDIGYGHLLMYDHVIGASHQNRSPPLSGPYTENDPFHDPLVSLAYLAAVTKRIELMTGVLIHPEPTPNLSRPPDNKSTSAACRATKTV